MESSLKKKRMRLIGVIVVVAALVAIAVARLNIEPSDYKVSISKQITKAQTMLSDAQKNVGNGKEQYAQYEVTAFQNQIDAAQEVVDDEDSYYEVEKETYQTLKQEMKEFKSAKNSTVMTQSELETLTADQKSESKQITLSQYRNLDWSIGADAITQPDDFNLLVREDGPYYSRILAYMEQFKMEGQTLAFYHSGEMPGTFQVTTTFYNSDASRTAGYVYRLDEATNVLSFAGNATLTADSASFSVKEGGSYMILAQDISNYATSEELVAMAAQISNDKTSLDVASAKAIQENKEKAETKKETAATSALSEETAEVAKATDDKKTEAADDKKKADTSTTTDSKKTTTSDQTTTSDKKTTTDKKTDSTSTDKNSSTTNKKDTTTSSGSTTTKKPSTGSSSNSTATPSKPSGSTGSGTTTTPTQKDDKITVTIEIRCDTLAKDLSKLQDSSLESYVPSNGTILAKTEYKCEEGTNVYDVLNAVCRNKDIQMESEYTAIYGSRYVKGINHLYEFNAGTYSGWLYKVNGEFPNYGCSDYELSDGDAIVWAYTCEEGDVRGSGL